jgi:hypothetical protein
VNENANENENANVNGHDLNNLHDRDHDHDHGSLIVESCLIDLIYYYPFIILIIEKQLNKVILFSKY